jgi:hypothetical protein
MKGYADFSESIDFKFESIASDSVFLVYSVNLIYGGGLSSIESARFS